RHRGHADGHTRGRVDVHRVEWRRLHRHGHLRRDAERRHHRDGDLHAVLVRAYGEHGRGRHRYRHQRADRHLLSCELHDLLHLRHGGHADCYTRRWLDVQRTRLNCRLDRPPTRRPSDLRHGHLRRDAERRHHRDGDLHAVLVRAYGEHGRGRHRYRHQRADRHLLSCELHDLLHLRHGGHADCYTRRW